jgi:hypothetical protein
VRTIKEIIETTIIENEKETKTKRVVEHIIRSWDELSREEKEKQIQAYSECIYREYQEQKYNIFLDEIQMLKEDYPHIHFEDIYLDSNSQGWWIDRIKDFRYEIDDLIVFNERVGINDIDFKIRRLIEGFDLDIWTYYIDSKTLSKIENTKKYQNWYNNIRKDVENWVNRVNDICSDLGRAEYECPYNLDDDYERDFLDNYFSDMAFTDTREVFENDKN